MEGQNLSISDSQLDRTDNGTTTRWGPGCPRVLRWASKPILWIVLPVKMYINMTIKIYEHKKHKYINTQNTCIKKSMHRINSAV
jgi:hypothetical protein